MNQSITAVKRETEPGEVMEVDFGHLGLTWDTATRSRRRTWMFLGRLRHSRLVYREVEFSQMALSAVPRLLCELQRRREVPLRRAELGLRAGGSEAGQEVVGWRRQVSLSHFSSRSTAASVTSSPSMKTLGMPPP